MLTHDTPSKSRQPGEFIEGKEPKEIQQDGIKSMNILFFHHSKLSANLIIHQLENRINPCQFKLNISSCCVDEHTTYTDFRQLSDKKAEFERLENLNLLIIEGNLGQAGAPEPGYLSTSIIEQAIYKNKEIIILIITGTVDCAKKLLTTYEQSNIYYITAKNLEDFYKCDELQPYIKDKRVFSSFWDDGLYEMIYSLLPPLSSDDAVAGIPLSQCYDNIREEFAIYESTHSLGNSEDSVSTANSDVPNISETDRQKLMPTKNDNLIHRGVDWFKKKASRLRPRP